MNHTSIAVFPPLPKYQAIITFQLELLSVSLSGPHIMPTGRQAAVSGNGILSIESYEIQHLFFSECNTIPRT